MRKTLLASSFGWALAAGLFGAGPVAAFADTGEDQAAEPRLMNAARAPIAGCYELQTGEPSGFYAVRMGGATKNHYCENTIPFNGRTGGWTLVWSNLRNTTGDLTTNLKWGEAVGTLQMYRVVGASRESSDLQTFEVYLGIRWWKEIIEANPEHRREIVYQWSADYTARGQDPNIHDRRAICTFDLNPDANWRIDINTTGCSVDQPSAVTSQPSLPDFFVYHSGRPFTTFDVDNDAHAQNCASLFSQTPWWYGTCWRGSINGGGETSENGHFNGAFWIDNTKQWGDRSTGQGAGNGWIFIR